MTDNRYTKLHIMNDLTYPVVVSIGEGTNETSRELQVGQCGALRHETQYLKEHGITMRLMDKYGNPYKKQTYRNDEWHRVRTSNDRYNADELWIQHRIGLKYCANEEFKNAVRELTLENAE